jgi:hypothetical protein
MDGSGISMQHVAGNLAGAQIMYGSGGNTGSKYAPPSMGSGVISLLGGRHYRLTILTANPSFNGWVPVPTHDLETVKIELFDSRRSLLPEFNRPECFIDVEIGPGTGPSVNSFSFGAHEFTMP